MELEIDVEQLIHHRFIESRFHLDLQLLEEFTSGSIKVPFEHLQIKNLASFTRHAMDQPMQDKQKNLHLHSQFKIIALSI